MRNMSFRLTPRQIVEKTKDVTRRVGWAHLEPGQRFRAVRKSMGLAPGEKVSPLAECTVLSVRREVLSRLVDDLEYGKVEVRREGFPNLSPERFMFLFLGSVPPSHRQTSLVVTRIEFRVDLVLGF